MATCLLRALHKKLPTKDKLLALGIISQKSCPFCQQQPESISHLFFECDYSAYIWSVCKLKLCLGQQGGNLEEDIKTLHTKFKAKAKCTAIARHSGSISLA